MAVLTAEPAAGAGGEAVRRRTPGWRVLARKELADHLRSVRFVMLMVLVGLSTVGAVQAAASTIRDAAPSASDTPGVFLALFTLAPQNLPSIFSFFGLVGFLIPLLGIAFGFDAVNSERAEGTLARLVSQAIYRDDVIIGKFAAGLGLIGLTVAVLTALVTGLGIFRLGVTPGAAELGRLALYVAVSMIYAGVWLAFAILASVVLRRAATSVLLCIVVWLFFVVFWTLLTGLATDAIAKAPSDATPQQTLRNARVEQTIDRLSPQTLYEEASTAVLSPQVRSLDILVVSQVDQAVPSQLSLPQSVLVAWPQLTVLVALIIATFTVAYVCFMRQEVRA